MKKILVTVAALLLAIGAWAIPAKPGVFTYTQPDGTVVRLELHGDEFYHWTTLAGSSQAVALDQDGYWRPVTLDPSVQEEALQRRRQVNNSRRAVSTRAGSSEYFHSTGEKHIPVLVVAYSDKDFVINDPQDQFNRMLNQNGYSDYGATGSVQDYYVENSHGKYTPIFDVYGPVTLPRKMSYYGSNDSRGNDKNPEIALYDAAVLLDDTVDFSQYDYDGDGFVDMILFYYAGYNEAEGGPADSIWPHSWNLQYTSNNEARSARFDGVGLAKYFCSSEFKGNSGNNMDGIGATCHEFAHALGLPDFYDTDYNARGYCAGLSFWSLMDAGCYLNDSRTPPYLNSEERRMLGWMKPNSVKQLPQGSFTFGPVKDNIAFRTLTDVEGEYFLYECRDGSGWDRFLPAGLLVYHVDKSTTRNVSGTTPYALWAYWEMTNSINAQGSHPCFYVVPAAAQSNLSYGGSLDKWVFPGSSDVTSFTPVDWDKHDTGISISNISYFDSTVSLYTNYESGGPGPDPEDPDDPVIPDPQEHTFAEYGITAIADAGSYAAGDVFLLKMDMPEGISAQISWKFDGLTVTDPVTLQAGKHTVTATLQYTDGSVETFELQINVK